MEDEGDDEEEKEDEVHLSCMKTSMLIQHEGDHLYKSMCHKSKKVFLSHIACTSSTVSNLSFFSSMEGRL